MSLTSIHGVDAEVLEILAKPDSKVTQVPINDLKFPKEAIIGGVIRGNKAWIVDRNFQINEGDKVVVFTKPGALKKSLDFFS